MSLTKLSHDQVAAILEQPDSFRSLIGYDYELTRDGGVLVKLIVSERHRNRVGSVHGGIPSVLMATAGAMSLYAADAGIEKALNISMNVSYFRNPRALLVARGLPERIGGTIAHVGVRLKEGGEGGETVASAQIVYRVIRCKGET